METNEFNVGDKFHVTINPAEHTITVAEPALKFNYQEVYVAFQSSHTTWAILAMVSPGMYVHVAGTIIAFQAPDVNERYYVIGTKYPLKHYTVLISPTKAYVIDSSPYLDRIVYVFPIATWNQSVKIVRVERLPEPSAPSIFALVQKPGTEPVHAVDIITNQLQLDNIIKPFNINSYSYYNIPPEPEESNIFGETLEKNTLVAFMDPKYRDQMIVARRADGTETESWKRTLQTDKNPWTREPINHNTLVYERIRISPTESSTGGKRNRKTYRRLKKRRFTRRR